MKTSRLFIIGVVFASIGVALSATPTHALSGSDFQAGNIIQDRTFYNNQSMSAAEIQAFLNSKVPSCTSGYTCLKNYTLDTPTTTDDQGLCAPYQGGTKVAAQIIYDIGLSCGVNPQVLLTLLQKESGLITATQPSSISYRSAAGYGCPDSTPNVCDGAYYGLFNQLYHAAWQYKYYAKHSAEFTYRPFRKNSILWHPDSSCGRSDVYIENQATASLYIYTPYRPNQAALNNLYGTGDGCSAYGNRNFWRLFSDWFGIDNKVLIRTTDSGTLYYTTGQYKIQVTSMDIANQYGFSDNDVAFVSQASLDSIPNSPQSPSLTYYVKSDSDSDEDGGNIYLVSNKTRYLITSMAQFAQFGLDDSAITRVPYYNLLRMPLAGTLSSFVSSPSGFVYKVDDGKKRGIFQGFYYDTLNTSKQISPLSDYMLSTLTTSSPLVSDSIPLRDQNGKIWIASSDGWYYVPSMNVLACMGFGSYFLDFTSTQAVPGQTLGTASCIVSEGSSAERYIIDGVNKYPVRAAWNIPAGSTKTTNILPKMPIVDLGDNPLINDPSNPSLYTIQNNKKRYIADIDSALEIGRSSATTVSQSILNYFVEGAPRYSSGTLISAPNGDLYVIANDTKVYIPSMNLFYSLSLKNPNSLSVSTNIIAAIPNGGTLSNRSAISGQSTLLDDGAAWTIPSSIVGSFPATQSLPAYPSGIARSSVQKTATRFIKSSSSAQLYYLDNGTKHYVSSWQKFTDLGGSANAISIFSDSYVNSIPIGASY